MYILVSIRMIYFHYEQKPETPERPQNGENISGTYNFPPESTTADPG